MKPCIILSLLFFLVSCGKQTDTSKTPSDQFFPHKVGNQWVYKFYGPSASGDEYIYVDIVDTGKLPDGESATVWTTTLQDRANNKHLIDSSFVVVDDQKAVFYGTPCWACTKQMPEEKRRYVFPLQVGKVWFTDKFFGDTTKVFNESSLNVPAGNFINTFLLSKTVGYVTNSFTKDTIWLTPNIGMTKFHQNEYSLGPIPGNGVWELANYSLK